MNRILVTGAGGYIGTTLVPLLLDEGYSVRAIDRFFFGQGLLPEHPRLEIVTEDTRKLALEHFEGVDAVIDLAAISNDPSGELFRDATLEINRDARACVRLGLPGRPAHGGMSCRPRAASTAFRRTASLPTRRAPPIL